MVCIPRLEVKRRDSTGLMTPTTLLDCGGKRSATPLSAGRARPQSGVALSLPAAVQERRIANLTANLGMHWVSGGTNQFTALAVSSPAGPPKVAQRFKIERGPRPPRALFSAPSRKTPTAGNCAEGANPPRVEDAGREGAASNARGGRAPRTSEFGLSRPAACR